MEGDVALECKVCLDIHDMQFLSSAIYSVIYCTVLLKADYSIKCVIDLLLGCVKLYILMMFLACRHTGAPRS